MRLLAISAALAATMNTALIAETNEGQCRVVKYRPNTVIYVQSRVHHGTRIQLPVPLLEPVNMSSLWDVQGVPGSIHVFVKPANMSEQGKSGQVALITQDNQAHNIIFTRVEGAGDYCVIIEHSGPFGDLSALAKLPVPAPTAADLAALQQDLEQQKQNEEQRIEDGIIRYQQKIYSDYEFNSSSIVRSVHDDGRFTYIVVQAGGFGLPVIYGLLEGKEILLEVEYESASQRAIVAGLFDGFRVVQGESETSVKRANRKTAGSFWEKPR